jgi:AcrR family transcriptional regulator
MESMAANPRPSKREAILNAMLDVVAERGFHEAPMSLIAERSGASAGVIYHYFESKEAIIQALYERVRELKRAGLLQGYSPEMDAKEAFILVWSNWYDFSTSMRPQASSASRRRIPTRTRKRWSSSVASAARRTAAF